MKIKIDPTKSRYNLLKRANDHMKDVPSIKYCYADINCRLKVKLNDENQKDFSFYSFDDFRDIVDMEIKPCLSICLIPFFVNWSVTKLLNEIIKYKNLQQKT